MARLRLAFFAVLLAGCAVALQTAGQKPEEDSHPHVIVKYGDTGGAIGLRYGFTTKPQEVLIRPKMHPWQQRRVVAHELFHATGWGRHFDYPGCYLRPTQGRDKPGEPCPQEVDAIKQVRRTLTIIRCDPALLNDVRWAVAMWNRAAGRTVFVVALD